MSPILFASIVGLATSSFAAPTAQSQPANVNGLTNGPSNSTSNSTSDGYSSGSSQGSTSASDQWDFKKDTTQLWMHKASCSHDQQTVILNSFAEAGYLANALAKWAPAPDQGRTKYQGSMDLYMGKDSNFNGGPSQTSWLQRIKNNLKRHLDFHSGKGPSNTIVYVYCNEDHIKNKKDRSCTDESGAQLQRGAYSRNSIGIFCYHELTLCDNFFNKGGSSFGMESMADDLKRIRASRDLAKKAESLWWNRGYTMFHEAWHWKDTIGNPEIKDQSTQGSHEDVYQPQDVAKEAETYGAESTSVIADAYAVAGLSNFLMDTFKLSEPPSPDPLTLNYKEPPTVALDGMPEGWKPPMSLDDPNATPATSDWVAGSASQASINPADYAPIS